MLIPFSHLRPEVEPLSQSVVQVPAVEACSGYSVRFFLEDVGAIGMTFPPGLPVAVIDRCTGGRLYALATPALLAERQYDAFDAMCDDARRGRPEDLDYPTDRFVGVVRMEKQRVLVDLSLAWVVLTNSLSHRALTRQSTADSHSDLTSANDLRANGCIASTRPSRIQRSTSAASNLMCRRSRRSVVGISSDPKGASFGGHRILPTGGHVGAAHWRPADPSRDRRSAWRILRCGRS